MYVFETYSKNKTLDSDLRLYVNRKQLLNEFCRMVY